MWILAALVVALAIATIGIRFAQDLATARARVQDGSQVVQTACGPIEYATIGDGPPVLVVHGAGGGYDQGLLFAEPLADKGFRAVTMSRFGYLRTPLPADASAEAQSDAHACLLDHLGIDRVAVIGASAGASSSLQLALRHPERVTALVLVVPALYAPRPPGLESVHPPAGLQFVFETVLRLDFILWAAIRVTPDTLIRTMFATRPELLADAPAEDRARVRRMLDEILPVSARRQGLLNDGDVITGIPRYALEDVAVPTLTLSVADDLFGTYDAARYAAEHIPGARFIGYPVGGHVWVGRHAQLVNDVGQFIRDSTQQ